MLPLAIYLSKGMSLQFTESDCRIFSTPVPITYFQYLSVRYFQTSCLHWQRVRSHLTYVFTVSLHTKEKIEKDVDVCASPLFTLWVNFLKGECCEAGESSGQLNPTSFGAHLCMPVTTSIMSHVDGSNSFNSTCRAAAALPWSWLCTRLWLSHYTLSINAIVLMY